MEDAFKGVTDKMCQRVSTNDKGKYFKSLGNKKSFISLGTKESLDEGERAGLKLIIQKTKIMATSPITSWSIDGEKLETVADFSSKITLQGMQF